MSFTYIRLKKDRNRIPISTFLFYRSQCFTTSGITVDQTIITIKQPEEEADKFNTGNTCLHSVEFFHICKRLLIETIVEADDDQDVDVIEPFCIRESKKVGVNHSRTETKPSPMSCPNYAWKVNDREGMMQKHDDITFVSVVA